MNLFEKFIAAEHEGNQTSAAKALGLSKSHVSRLVRGERSVTPELAEKIEVLTNRKYLRQDFIWPNSAKESRNAA